MNVYYVYHLRLEHSDKPFYVGKGKGRRRHEHFIASRICTSSIKNNIIRSATAKGINIISEIVKGNLSEQDAFELEVQLISRYGRLDKGTGILGNHTDGGDGTSGYAHSQEAKDKVSAANTGRVFSSETRARMSSTHIGMRHTKETLARMSVAQKGHIKSPETRARLSAANMGHKHSDETRAKLSASSFRAGKRPGNVKLSTEIVLEIYSLLKMGERGCSIAAKYGVCKQTITLVKQGKSFPDLYRHYLGLDHG